MQKLIFISGKVIYSVCCLYLSSTHLICSLITEWYRLTRTSFFGRTELIRDPTSILCSEKRKYVKWKNSVIHFCIFCLLTYIFIWTFSYYFLTVLVFFFFPAASRGQLNLNYLLVIWDCYNWKHYVKSHSTVKMIVV